MLQQERCRRADEDAEKIAPKRAALLLLFLLQIAAAQHWGNKRRSPPQN